MLLLWLFISSDSIESHVELASVQVNLGNQQLKRAKSYQVGKSHTVLTFDRITKKSFDNIC